MDVIENSLFVSRIQAVCDEMGATLQRTAFSPNIKDRLDFSCAVFDNGGNLCAQAAHIPVHLGSMAYAMAGIVSRVDWQPGDMIILNDPYLGGTHLPDVTVIAPLYIESELCAFVANRAHHADIGADTPGSMPLAGSLAEEGLVISPVHLLRRGKKDIKTFHSILEKLHNPALAEADYEAQASANLTGLRRLDSLVKLMGRAKFAEALNVLNEYAETLARSSLRELPRGEFEFTDVMDDDGLGHDHIPIKARLQIEDDRILVDFSGTAPQVKGNINCPLSVTAAAVYYCFYCLMPPHTPACAGAFRMIELKAEPGSLVNARFPAAVAAGNVETSSRIVDVILGALAKTLPDNIPAASHGSMNNIAMGSDSWDYYETLGGGSGAGSGRPGCDAIQTHMTNTLNTPIEILEKYYPLRIRQYAIRRNSGGTGQFKGGDGLVREYEFLEDCHVTLLTERRTVAPWGIAEGQPGAPGLNRLNDEVLPGKTEFSAHKGERLTIMTPGGGGWGKPRVHGES